MSTDDAATIGAQRQASLGERTTPRLYADRAHENRVGYIAERAFAERYHLTMPPTWDGRGDAGYDFRAETGRSIDVKGSYKRPWMLPIKIKDFEKGAADVYVLGWVKGSRVEWVGWVSRKDVEKRREPYTGTVGEPSWMVRTPLRRIETLDKYLRPIEAKLREVGRACFKIKYPDD